MLQRFLKCFDATLGALAVSFWPVTGGGAFLPSKPKSVLFIRPGGIGDAALLIPAIKELRERFPTSRIDVLAEQRNARVFDFCPVITDVFCYDRPSDWCRIWRRRYDLVIDTEQWHRLSALFGRVIGGGFLVGFGTNNRARLLNRAIDYDLDRYEAFSFLSLLAPLGVDLAGEIQTPFLELVDEGRENIESRLAGLPSGPRVALCPGGSRPEKSWGEDRYAELARQLADQGVFPVVLGGPGDAAASARIAAAGDGLNLAGETTLFESVVALQRCNVVVANDTGLLHLAFGLDTPTVGLFGPSDPGKWGPRGGRHRVIWKHPLCAPCARYGNMPDCTQEVRCLQDIGVDNVLDAVQALLSP